MHTTGSNETNALALNDDVVGFAVEGRDGKIGKIEYVNYTGSHATVACGRLVKKTKHVFPARAVEAIDSDSKTVRIALTNEQVGESPAYDPHTGIDETCEARVAEYYAEVLPH